MPQEHDGDLLVGKKAALAAFRAAVSGYEDEACALLDRFLLSGELVSRRVEQLSYGERAKLTLAILVAGSANTLLLNEPTRHLDGAAIRRIAAALVDYPGPLIVASHDRHVLARIGVTAVLALDAGRLQRFATLEEYEATGVG